MDGVRDWVEVLVGFMAIAAAVLGGFRWAAVYLKTQLGEMIDVKLDEKLDAKLDEKVMPRFEAIDRRFDAMDARFEAIDARFDAMDRRFDAMDVRADAFEATTDLRLKSLESDVHLIKQHLLAGVAAA